MRIRHGLLLLRRALARKGRSLVLVDLVGLEADLLEVGIPKVVLALYGPKVAGRRTLLHVGAAGILAWQEVVLVGGPLVIWVLEPSLKLLRPLVVELLLLLCSPVLWRLDASLPRDVSSCTLSCGHLGRVLVLLLCGVYPLLFLHGIQVHTLANGAVEGLGLSLLTNVVLLLVEV